MAGFDVSVILRSKNEARWIARCVHALSLQQYDGGIEIVLVDNESKDGTAEIARSLGCRVISISDKEFTYGRALNRGIAASAGEFIATLSAHCIPVNDQWAVRLVSNFHVPAVAGVYGRQEPLPDSSDFDKRDLWTTFGHERRIQRKDYFFHNANGMIRRSIWQTMPFDEQMRGVEDRAWAKQALRAGFLIVYEPAASVYHHHGIHQGRDEKRARRVAQVIEMIHHGR